MTAATRIAAIPDLIRTVDWRRFANFRRWRRWLVRSLVRSGRLTALLFLVLAYFVRVDNPTWLQFLQAKTFDTYQEIKPRPFHADTPVVIADIDEKSIDELAQWQWPRTVFADLVNRLTEMNAEVIAFDVGFSESDRTSLGALAASHPDLDEETRSRLAKSKDNDEAFAEAIKASGRVVLGMPTPPKAKTEAQSGPTTSFVAIGANPNPNLARYPSLMRDIPILDKAAAGHGVYDFTAAFDGIVRSVPMVLMVDSARYPALSLETLRVALGARSINIKSAEDGVKDIILRPRASQNSFDVPTERHADLRVYFTPHSAYEANYISISDIVKGRVDPARIAGKIVLVGTSAAGLYDVRATPLDPALPGVEVHANILENVIFGESLHRPPQAEGLEVLAALALSLVVIVVTPWVGAIAGFASFAILSGGMMWWSWSEFARHHALYDPVFAVVLAFLIYSFLTIAAFNREESQKKQIRGAFGQYLSPAVVEQLASDPSQLKLGGENKFMTFMFSDVRGFTSISELFDAEGLTQLINRLLTPLTDVILANKGTIDKYMGDCVMAFWNAPLPVPDHERQACRAAFGMLEQMAKLNAALAEEAKAAGREHRPLAVGIGLNSGVACVGNMGSTQRFGYSVLGDSVNLASRLEGQSKAYGVTIVVGDATAAKIQDFATLELDLIKVKGKTEAVRIFTVLGDEATARGPEFLALKKAQKEFLEAYRAQNWDRAEDIMTAASATAATAATAPGLLSEMVKYYEIYAERIAEYRTHPPGPGWDTVYVATSK